MLSLCRVLTTHHNQTRHKNDELENIVGRDTIGVWSPIHNAAAAACINKGNSLMRLDFPLIFAIIRIIIRIQNARIGAKLEKKCHYFADGINLLDINRSIFDDVATQIR